MRIILSVVLVLSGAVFAQDPLAEILDTTPALNGNSPVEMIDAGAVIKGKPQFASNYLGFTYHFSSEASKRKFDAHPDDYNIRLDGHCPVGLAGGRILNGNQALFSMFDQRIFIFKDEASKAAFDLEPSRYVARRSAAATASYSPAPSASRPAG